MFSGYRAWCLKVQGFCSILGRIRLEKQSFINPIIRKFGLNCIINRKKHRIGKPKLNSWAKSGHSSKINWVGQWKFVKYARTYEKSIKITR